jgi:hypothetical protein
MLSVNPLGDLGAVHLARGLRENRTLEELGLASCGISAEGAQLLFAALEGHPSLRELDLGYGASTRVLGAAANNLSDGGALAAACFLRSDPPLQRLSLRVCGIGQQGREALASALAANSHLVELELDGREIPEIRSALQRNRAARGERPPPQPEVAMIRSVYRTDRRAARMNRGECHVAPETPTNPTA